MKNKKGFTLIEILVVIVLISILGLILTNVLTQVLRGQNKINVVSLVKQNGQLVLDKLSGEIRQAEKIICVVADVSSDTDTIVIFKQGVYTRFRFYSPKPEPVGEPPTNGYIAWDNPAEEALACSAAQIFPSQLLPTSISEGAVSLEFDDIPSADIVPLSIAKYLTNTDPTTGVSLDYLTLDQDPQFINRIFKRDELPGFGDMITIKFKATAGVSAGQAYETTVKEGGVLFSTTVQVRGGK